MLLKSYTRQIFRPECIPDFQSLHCFVHLDQDIGEVLPYLNSALGGSGYTKDPPALMLQVHGRLITLYAKKIAINALKDEKEAAGCDEQKNKTYLLGGNYCGVAGLSA